VFVSQKGQDRWVVEEIFRGKREGFFLDLAASDGVAASNTLVLERLGWNGIAIEADPIFASRLFANRSCQSIIACVDEDTREIEYLQNKKLGGIVASDTDNCHEIRSALIEQKRAAGKIISMTTVPLASILDSARAPAIIDYFSFDVEGAETRILRSFPFDRYSFLAMTIERPTPELNERLFQNGYIFVKNVRFDSFYVHKSLPHMDKIVRQPFEQVPPKNW
jgi:hypothetical protein